MAAINTITEVLLSSEKFIKNTTNISDNVAGKFILPSLREAQEINFRGIVGDCLLNALKQMVADNVFVDPIQPEYLPYKELLDRAQYYLAYQTIVEVCGKVTYKIGNFGVAKSSDENLQPVGPDELDQQRTYYQSKADAHCYQLQGWLLENRASFPELRDCDCSRMKANLYSAATCGIWLGGPRSKIITNKRNNPFRRALPRDILIVGTGLSWFGPFSAFAAAGGVKQHWFDIAGFGRSVMTDNDFIPSILEGRTPDRSRACVGCDSCFQLFYADLPTGCPVNHKAWGDLYKAASEKGIL